MEDKDQGQLGIKPEKEEGKMNEETSPYDLQGNGKEFKKIQKEEEERKRRKFLQTESCFGIRPNDE